MLEHNANERMLCLDVRASRSGFAVFAGVDRLIDFGVTRYSRQRGPINMALRRSFQRLVQLHSPSLIVFRLPSRVPDERNQRAKVAVRILRREANRQSIPMRLVSRERIREFFKVRGLRNKQRIAVYLAEMFADLARKVPQIRKKWQPEKFNMSVFDAVAAGVLVRSEDEGQIL
jgi:hypothetical protein